MAGPLSRRRLLLAGLGLTGLGVLGGCGLGTAGGFIPSATLAGPLASVPDLEGEPVAVGSKNFTEQLIVGKMAVILFAAAGAQTSDFTNIPGSSSTRQALIGNELQMVWEYTGTAWIAYLGNTDPIPDEQEQWQAVAAVDLKENGLVWLPPAPMNNTYGFAVKRSEAERLGITRLSQLQDIPVEERTLCVESEFNSRNDGLRPMLETYGVPIGSGVPQNQVKIFDTGAIYAATDQGECLLGEVFTTDGRIKALDLVVLEDDRNFFPKYNLSAVVQADLMERRPQVADLLAPVTGKLTSELLMELNAKVDVDGLDPTKVAFDWLITEGFVTAGGSR